MATIAVHRESGARYVLLGVSVRMFSPASLTPATRPAGGAETSRQVPVMMAAACDEAGAIQWFRTDELLVTEVDGQSPASLLRREGYR
jgi:hypothetical protein